MISRITLCAVSLFQLSDAIGKLDYSKVSIQIDKTASNTIPNTHLKTRTGPRGWTHPAYHPARAGARA